MKSENSKVPPFTPSNSYVFDAPYPCLTTKEKNSALPQLAKRYIEISQTDPEFRVFLRGHETNKISVWQRKILERLFDKEELLKAIEIGMREYETSGEFAGYDKKDENYEDIKQHGILPHLILKSIIIDEISCQVILSLSTVSDGNLEEHGINIYLQDDRWRFDHAEYVANYVLTLQSEGRKRRLLSLYPPDESALEIEPNLTFLYGTWEFDENETKVLLMRLGSPEKEVMEDLATFQGFQYRIKKDEIVFRKSWYSKLNLQFLGCEKRGNKLTLKIRPPGISEIKRWDLYYENNLLVDAEQGLVLRKNKKV